MDAQFKIRELAKRQQREQDQIPLFRSALQDPRKWEPVAAILKQGVGASTLPCVKLRAIVDSASEIHRIFSSTKNNTKTRCSNTEDSLDDTMMSADEFLPIFIYCVVQAEIERPCALTILLKTLCDPINRIGETGYYLASFEAAIAHLEEADLNDGVEEKDEMNLPVMYKETQTSFVSIALEDS